ncbi:MAG TPA: DUF4332 domain-containing protein, partial [Longimicrobium sp.]|nr:DUF4332 domain-containing protein [Longimicrobium sp.]
MTYRLHDIEEIEGIGPVRAQVLRRRGIRYTEDLLRFSLTALLRRLARDAGFPLASMGRFRAQAALMQVPGLTYQFAEAIFWTDRRGLSMLAAPHPREIVADVERARAANLLNDSVNEETVLRWQKRAIAIDHSGRLAGIVADETHRPIAGAVVRVGHERAETAADGRFWLPLVPYGRIRASVSARGFRTYTGWKVIRPRQPVPLQPFVLVAGQDPVETVDERAGGFIARITPDDRRSWVPTPVSELPEGTALWFSRRLRDGRAILHGVQRKKVGRVVQIPKVTVPRDWVPAAVKSGTVFVWKQGT